MLNWIRKIFVKRKPDHTKGYINTQFAFIRSEPSYRAFVQVAIPYGEQVVVLNEGPYFYFVSCLGLHVSGWIAKDEVTIK
ncbi:MAG: hypothetical protein R3321_02160 [Nitrososphaeraceae archaeon]|nr:hypothetical protein [Nitrososphaeraceae archaeon]